LSGPQIKGGGPQVKGGKAKKINTAEFFQDKKIPPPQKIFSIGKFLTWLHYAPRTLDGLGYLKKHFEFYIRNPDWGVCHRFG
jgi:hypothetical protein